MPTPKPTVINPERKRLHDMQNAAAVLGDFVDMVKEGFDFSSEEGQKYLTEASEAKDLLVREILALRAKNKPK